MKPTVTATTNDSGLYLLQQMQSLLSDREQEIASLKHQLAWFKQQLFGDKSEKRLIDNPDQLALGEILKDAGQYEIIDHKYT